jgi:hypothetical protein
MWSPPPPPWWAANNVRADATASKALALRLSRRARRCQDGSVAEPGRLVLSPRIVPKERGSATRRGNDGLDRKNWGSSKGSRGGSPGETPQRPQGFVPSRQVVNRTVPCWLGIIIWPLANNLAELDQPGPVAQFGPGGIPRRPGGLQAAVKRSLLAIYQA